MAAQKSNSAKKIPRASRSDRTALWVTGLIIVVGAGAALLWPASSPPASPTPSAAANANSSAPTTGLRGTAVVIGDVEPVSTQPLSALIAAIPASAFQQQIADDLPDPSRFVFELKLSQIQSAKATVVTTGSVGNYALDLPAGPYLICLGNLGNETSPTALPATMVGCANATVPDGAKAERQISWGLGGVMIDTLPSSATGQ